jgi:hypothetical protein
MSCPDLVHWHAFDLYAAYVVSEMYVLVSLLTNY